MRNSNEYVLYGHPDRLCDVIAETIAMAIYNLDGIKGRAAVEALYTNGNFVIGGEFKTSLEDEDFNQVVDWIIKTILKKQSSDQIIIDHIWQNQSPEIHQASIGGWGDNSIAYGYCSKQGKNVTYHHQKLKEIGHKITQRHQKELPDGKLIQFNHQTTISIENGIDKKFLKKLGINEPTIFNKSGSSADSGTVGRKLIAEGHGIDIAHGGGAFVGKDFTKSDKTFKLIADQIAQDIWKNQKIKKEVLVQISTKFGQRNFYVQSSVNFDLARYQKKEMHQWLRKEVINDLYNKFAPVKPSHVLKKKEIKELENLLLKLSGKNDLINNLW